MNMRDPEFIEVRVHDASFGSRTFRAATFEDAFDRLGLWGTRWCDVLDGGDRVIIEELRRCGWFERPETKDVNWKRFRKTRWRERR